MIPTHVIYDNGQPWLWLHHGPAGWHYAHSDEPLVWYVLVDQIGHYQRRAQPVEWQQLELI